MLNPKYYNIANAKKMAKDHFYKAYSKTMPDIDKVWAWLQKWEPEKEPKKEVKK